MAIVPPLDELEFKTTAQVELFAKWYLRTSAFEAKDEYASEQERQEFERRRKRRLQSEVDQLHSLNLNGAVAHQLDQELYHIGPDGDLDPMSQHSPSSRNSRFNYKSVELFRNNVVYFGANRRTCYVEKFHLPIQRHNYAKLLNRSPDEIAAELPRQKYKLWKYHIKLKNVLVLTSDTAMKAAGIAAGVVKNEWYTVNDEFEIPTAGQILATLAKQKLFNGILYTSVRNQTKSNLVVFLENIKGLEFQVLDDRPYDPSEEIEER